MPKTIASTPRSANSHQLVASAPIGANVNAPAPAPSSVTMSSARRSASPAGTASSRIK
jgi:hypothetical protein